MGKVEDYDGNHNIGYLNREGQSNLRKRDTESYGSFASRQPVE